MAVLPPEIIVTGVLSRLPVISLLRFRSVSKSWCVEIDSPYFINLHLNLSTASKSNLSLFTSHPYGWEVFLFSIYSDSDYTEIRIPFVNFNDKIRVWGSCNGLLLLRGVGSFFLFNPSTKKHLVLPDSPMKIKDSDEEHCFLVYDAINDDYRVFSILLLIRDTWITTEARVYSLKSNSWRTIKNFDDCVMNSEKVVGFTYVNGALHSLNETRDLAKFENIVAREIIAVDIESGARHVIPMPESMGKYDFCFMTNTLVGGCLCVLNESIRVNGHTSSVDIWVMKEYGVRESWSMLLSVVFPDFSNFQGKLIFYSNSSNEVLLHYDDDRGDQLVWYDLQTGTARNFLARGFPIVPQELNLCVESLV